MKPAARTFVAALLMALACCSHSSCTGAEQETVPGTSTGTEDTEGQGQDQNDTDSQMNMYITVTVNGRSFAATLEDSATARAFAQMLPATFSMSELNGNEKYFYLDKSLPTDSTRPGTINAGDIMLYGSDCLVLFYETFSSAYSYTRIGKIDNPEGLSAAAGSGSAQISFEFIQQ